MTKSIKETPRYPTYLVGLARLSTVYFNLLCVHFSTKLSAAFLSVFNCNAEQLARSVLVSGENKTK